MIISVLSFYFPLSFAFFLVAVAILKIVCCGLHVVSSFLSLPGFFGFIERRLLALLLSACRGPFNGLRLLFHSPANFLFFFWIVLSSYGFTLTFLIFVCARFAAGFPPQFPLFLASFFVVLSSGLSLYASFFFELRIFSLSS